MNMEPLVSPSCFGWKLTVLVQGRGCYCAQRKMRPFNRAIEEEESVKVSVGAQIADHTVEEISRKRGNPDLQP